MAYEVYVTQEFYQDTHHGEIPEEEQEKYLKQASRHVDTLTYNRIVGKGIFKLTEFQKEIIQEVVCEQADFEYQNREIFDMILQGYSINGVSMQFGNSWNIITDKGVPMRRDIYDKLCQTGLCCRLVR